MFSFEDYSRSGVITDTSCRHLRHRIYRRKRRANDTRRQAKHIFPRRRTRACLPNQIRKRHHRYPQSIAKTNLASEHPSLYARNVGRRLAATHNGHLIDFTRTGRNFPPRRQNRFQTRVLPQPTRSLKGSITDIDRPVPNTIIECFPPDRHTTDARNPQVRATFNCLRTQTALPPVPTTTHCCTTSYTHETQYGLIKTSYLRRHCPVCPMPAHCCTINRQAPFGKARSARRRRMVDLPEVTTPPTASLLSPPCH